MHDTLPFIAPGEQQAQTQASRRAWALLMLSPTPEVWSQLLQNQPVPEDQLDQHWLRRHRQRRARDAARTTT